eukprot:9402360-Pyramimonas_sp.AAC.1
MIFKTLSRHGAFSLSSVVRATCSSRLFLLLVGADDAKLMLGTSRASSLGEFTQTFLGHFGIDSVDSAFALAELSMVAVQSQLATVQPENSNAGIKRAVDVASTH